MWRKCTKRCTGNAANSSNLQTFNLVSSIWCRASIELDLLKFDLRAGQANRRQFSTRINLKFLRTNRYKHLSLENESLPDYCHYWTTCRRGNKEGKPDNNGIKDISPEVEEIRKRYFVLFSFVARSRWPWACVLWKPVDILKSCLHFYLILLLGRRAVFLLLNAPHLSKWPFPLLYAFVRRICRITYCEIPTLFHDNPRIIFAYHPRHTINNVYSNPSRLTLKSTGKCCTVAKQFEVYSPL